jgi:hypothetical protein
MDLARDVAFSEIEPQINDLLRSAEEITVLVLNSSSRDLLDYERNPTLKVVLIGGNRLSRGLTLESLTVSFYVRESENYDTLLQMGRWFGYRNDYVDLTRLWTTSELFARFRHLALVEEDLRDQIAIYEREGLTPLHVAPRIRAHPAMLVTAKNRMGSAEYVRQSYAGELLQTIRFRLGNDEWLQANLDCAKELLAALGEPTGDVRNDSTRPTWRNIPWPYIVGFLERFRTAQDAISFDADTAARYIRKQAEYFEELTSWTVSVRSGLSETADLKSWDMGIEGLAEVPAISRSLLATDDGSIGVLTNPSRKDQVASGDEAVDLSDDQLAAARTAIEDERFPTVGHALRWQRPRTHGLLLLYPISPYSKPGLNSNRNGTLTRVPLFEDPVGRPLVVGVALSFPPSKTGATVEYVAGRPSRFAINEMDDE